MCAQGAPARASVAVVREGSISPGATFTARRSSPPTGEWLWLIRSVLQRPTPRVPGDAGGAHMYRARLRRTPYSASGLVAASPTLSWIAATARSRRFGRRAASAASSAADISRWVRSVP